MKFYCFPLILLIGVAMPVEAAMNARLRESLHSPTLGTLVSFAVGLAATGLLLAAGLMGRGCAGAGAGSVPWWAWLGGVLGVLIVFVSLVAVSKVGAAVLIVVTVLGQVAMSLAMDAGGWLGVPEVPLNAWRIAGALLVLVGVLLTTKK